MSRIDVVPAEKHKFKVLVNFIQRGVDFSSGELANLQAKKIHCNIPNAQLHLIKS